MVSPTDTATRHRSGSATWASRDNDYIKEEGPLSIKMVVRCVLQIGAVWTIVLVNETL